MAKKTTAFFCSECGYESAKWLGQCPGCREWNTFVEEPVTKTGRAVRITNTKKPSLLKDISTKEEARMTTGFGELDRVLGGGIVRGSLTLIGGDPGIGKSTILLQVCKNLSDQGRKVLYISGEESLKQIKIRADRIGQFNDNIRLFCETDLELIEQTLRDEKPDVAVIDSIQTIYNSDVSSAPGSVSQVRESTNILMQTAKTENISIFVVGHVTKEGVVAGPRVLEHMVDTVLYFEGDRHASYRILRGVKNRFGSTNEIGVFEMCQNGLQEVKNPSEYMLNGRPENASGSVVACTIEGTRPILAEIQALVCRTNFGMPRRTAAGTDYNRVNLLMAVLEKRLGFHMGEFDAYVNVAGGIKIDEKTIVFGEVGLSGEVRAVNMAERRVAEAVKLGFTRCIMPAVSRKGLTDRKGIDVIGVKNIQDLLKYL